MDYSQEQISTWTDPKADRSPSAFQHTPTVCQRNSQDHRRTPEMHFGWECREPCHWKNWVPVSLSFLERATFRGGTIQDREGNFCDLCALDRREQKQPFPLVARCWVFRWGNYHHVDELRNILWSNHCWPKTTGDFSLWAALNGRQESQAFVASRRSIIGY